MTPLTLVGNTLGERHHYLNNKVNEAYKQNHDVHNIEDLPENSAVDRIFKIHLASKLRDTEYIIKNLKDDDMLFVSKALKCTWLLESEFEQFINPEYLESQLYPSMTTTAVTKMKRWLFVNLKEVERCRRFFLYYHEKDFKFALHFLKNCTSDFVKEQFPKIIQKLPPDDFKVLCEKTPEIMEIFYDNLKNNEVLMVQYLKKQNIYFKILKSLLKMKADMVLDITEKYFDQNTMNCFSSNATKYIMKHHKIRFLQKPELYTVLLLDLKTLANCLDAKEATDLILNLARSKRSIGSHKWFSYKRVEPLIKRLKPEDRGPFKKRIFEDKEIGEEMKDLSYKLPSPPVLIKKQTLIFKDIERNPNEYKNLGSMDFRYMLKKKKFCRWNECKKSKTMLDKLFDEYRVASFDKTLFELRKKIKAESSAQNRQYMMLVLVSKSGGREDNITKLMQLLSDYKNEPPHLRATVVRSLVKRAFIWRVPEETWKRLLEFAHGLGLDGKPPEADCVEGIHAVVIRQLLFERKCNPDIFAVYLKNFSTLTEYSLSIEERESISHLLLNVLYNAVTEKSVSSATNLMNNLLDILTAFGLRIENYPSLITKIKSLSPTEINEIDSRLNRLYKSRIARRELFEVNFYMMKTEESYLNALRHNAEVISPNNLLEEIVKYKLPYQKFFSKISVYFNEEKGLAKEFLNVLKVQPPHRLLFAKAITLLIGDELEFYLKNLDNSMEQNDKRFAAAIRANVHLARPALNIESFGWKNIGTKAVANKVLICRDIEVDSYFQKLLQNKRTFKIALNLSKRNGKFIDVFKSFTLIKPRVAIKTGLKYLKNHKNLTDLKVWEIIKPLTEKLDICSVTKHFLKHYDVLSMPTQIRPEYSVIIYNSFKKLSFYESMPFLCHIENLLPEVDKDFIENVLQEFLNYFAPRKQTDDCVKDDYAKCICLYLRILIKYLLLCESREIQEKKFESIGVIFFNKMEVWLASEPIQRELFHKYYLQEILKALVYYKAFLSSKYVSCMPLLEKTLCWIQKKFPIEKHFKINVHMQLNILYYTAFRTTLDKLSTHCIDDSNELEAKTMVANSFGQYLGREMNAFTKNYFDSAKYLYKDVVISLSHFFHLCPVYMETLINAILDQSDHGAASYILAIYLLKHYYCLGKKCRDEIARKIRENDDIEVQMIFSEEIPS